MKIFIILIVVILCYTQCIRGQQTNKRLLCYYEYTTAVRQGNPQFTKRHLLKALQNCTHLMYGFAQLQPQNYTIHSVTLNPEPTILKSRFPHLKIFLSLGGNKNEVDSSAYLRFLEAGALKYKNFTENAVKFLKLHNFNGLDLAFPFPRNKAREVHTRIGMVIKNVKEMFTGDFIVDDSADKHKQQYTELVNGLSRALHKENLQLSMTVLPNVNSSWYFDINKIHRNFKFINLFAFDFLTPARNPEEADYTAPIYFKGGVDRLPHYNVEYQVDHWIHNGCPANKLNLGIATYGRAWKLTTDSGLSGHPIVESTNGPAAKGKITHTAGVLSWPEICIKLSTKDALLKVSDKEGKYGNYAFRPADKKGQSGTWVSFDGPQFAAIKTEYVKQRGMGGVALYDLRHDDFQGFCKEKPFPILSSVSKGLGIIPHSYKVTPVR